MHPFFVKGLDGRTKCMQVSSSLRAASDQKDRFLDQIKTPSQLLRIVSDNCQIGEDTPPADGRVGWYPQIHLFLCLRRGKGGFGPIPRSDATKAGQRKTRNVDACNDKRGRRLRHVNDKKGSEVFHTDPENATKEGGPNAEDLPPHTTNRAKSGRSGKDYTDLETAIKERGLHVADLPPPIIDRAKYCRSGMDLSDLFRSRQKIGGNLPDPETKSIKL